MQKSALLSPSRLQAKMLHNDDSIAVIGMYGIVFGGSDMEGDGFRKSTDFRLKDPPQIPVHIDHTKDTYIKVEEQVFMLKGIEDEVGRVIEVSPDDYGLYMKLQFEKSNKYWRIVDGMYKSGRLGASTTSDHRTRQKSDGTFDVWTIGETTLTLHPMEPRTAGTAERLKAANTETITYRKGGKSITIDAEGFDEQLNVNEIIKSINSDTDSTEDQMPEAQEAAESQIEAETETPVEEIEGEISPQGGEEPPESKTVMETEKEAVEPQVKSFDFEGAFSKLMEEVGSTKSMLLEQNQKLEDQEERLKAFEQTPANDIKANVASSSTPKYGIGSNESEYIKAWALGDTSEDKIELKASNPTDMNIGTPADGGNLVPVGFYEQIIMKANESSLLGPDGLPVFRIPGTEHSVQIPTYTGDDGRFIETAEAGQWDQDAPPVGQEVSTLKYFTKWTDVSYQLLQSNGVAGSIEGLLSNYFGLGMALTHNDAVNAEIVANGTQFGAPAFVAGGAIAFGELENILGNGILGRYMSVDNQIRWVGQNSTLWNIRTIAGPDRQYWMNHDSDSLLGYRYHKSESVDAMGTGNQSLLFGNWNYLAYRQMPNLTVRRNESTRDIYGQIRFSAYFAFALTVTQSEAIGYAQHA